MDSERCNENGRRWIYGGQCESAQQTEEIGVIIIIIATKQKRQGPKGRRVEFLTENTLLVVS